MLQLKSFKYLVPALAMLCCVQANAQNTNSIYSAYGIGDVNIRDWNAYASMGGVGIALKSERTLNELNPASYSGLTNHRFILEVAGGGTTVHYISANDNKVANDFNIKRAAFGMNLFKNMGTVFGLRKYSSVAYQTSALRYVSGTNTSIDESIIGSGGINQAFITNSYSFGRHLSIGVSTGLLFGSVNKKEVVNFNSTDGIKIDNNNYYNRMFLNTGFQYQFKTGKIKWMIGGTYQPAIKLNNQVTSQITNLSDTVLKAAAVVNSSFKYPEQMGAGISVKRAGSMLAFDYIRQNWSKTGYKGESFNSTDLQNFAAGYSYTWYRNTVYGPMEKLSLMAGFQKDMSYLVINNKQVTSVSGSAGVNIPSKNGMYNYTIGLRAGQRGQVLYPLVKEKFVDLTLNISLSSLFYIGGRKYD